MAAPQIQADSRGSPGGGVGDLGGVTKWHQPVTLAHCCRQGDDEHLSFKRQEAGFFLLFEPRKVGQGAFGRESPWGPKCNVTLHPRKSLHVALKNSWDVRGERCTPAPE